MAVTATNHAKSALYSINRALAERTVALGEIRGTQAFPAFGLLLIKRATLDAGQMRALSSLFGVP